MQGSMQNFARFVGLTVAILAHGLVACSTVSRLPIIREPSDQKQVLETQSMVDIDQRVLELRRRFGAENVLVVFDIDNTILTTKQLIGSDPWFTWQAELLRENAKSQTKVAHDIGHLLRIQRSLFAVSALELTQPELPDFLRRLQMEGHPILALTSRNANMMPYTLRELRRFGISFADSRLSPPTEVRAGTLPDTVAGWQKYGFSPKEIKEFKLLEMRRPVAFQDGVMHVSGQDKGAILRLLVQNETSQPKSIVFIDDQAKHVSSVQRAFLDKDLNLVTFRYGAIDIAVESFTKGRGKVMASREWNILQRACRHSDPIRFSAMLRAVFDNELQINKARELCRSAFN